jgi:glyoxylase-like metal-dependent hydrolase (beta-lactamase superfamily II)
MTPEKQRPKLDLVVRPAAGTLAWAAAGLVRGLASPTPPDQGFLSTLVDAGVPASSTVVTLQALPQVTRWVPAPFVVEGVRRPRRLGLVLTAFVVRHSRATILLDPGICADVRRRAINELRAPLRVAVRPPADLIPIRQALDMAGIAVDEIDFALPTHIHWDHVAGLLDLPDLPVRLHDVERAWAMTGQRAPVGGVRAALRDRPLEEYRLDGPPVLTFPRSHDLLGDGAIVIVDLSGHTPGSVGVLLNTTRGRVLVAGDAVWHTAQLDALRPKPAYPGLLADNDPRATFRTVHRLYAVRDHIHILPSHDRDAAVALAGLNQW